MARPVLDLAASKPLAGELSPAVVAAFEAQIDKGGDCWLWTGKVNNKGYGLTAIPRAGLLMAHRAAYALWVGEPGKLHVLHHCDVTRCVNPEHLWLGTNAENHADKILKGRGDYAFGTRQPNSKLDDRAALAIYRMVHAGIPQGLIAKAFDISESTVFRIGDGSRWPHIAAMERRSA